MGATILLADDHAMVRAGLRRLVESKEGLRVIAEAGDGEEAVQRVAETQPDLAVMDISMPRVSGVEAVRRIRQDYPRTRCLMVSMHETWPHVEHALQAGASGYVVKTAAPSELLGAIDAVLSGKTYLSPAVADQLVDRVANPQAAVPRVTELTNREREVLQLVAEGYSTKEISHLLGVAFKTVESHRNRLMFKLNIHKVPHLVRFAIRNGLVAP